MLEMKQPPTFKRHSIGLDMDNTMFDFTSQFVKFYNLMHPDNIITCNAVNADWDFGKFCKYDIQEIFRLPGFYSTMEAYEGMEEVYMKLCEEYFTYIVTTTPPEQIYERIISLKFLNPKFEQNTFFLASQKDMIKVDVIVDDAPHNFKNITERDDGQIMIIYDHLYNRHLDTKYRAYLPEDILYFAKNYLIRKNDIILSKKTFFYPNAK